MTLYLVTHGSESSPDWRLHRWRDESHTELYQFNGSIRPGMTDMIDALAETHNGASILGDPDARRDTIELAVGLWNVRSVDNVPW